MPFRFQLRQRSTWFGRYHIIPGNTTRFHVRIDGQIDLISHVDGYVITYLAVMTPQVQNLARALNQTKQACTGHLGGSFIINEYGQVICPVADDSYNRYYVGDCSGSIAFLDPDDGAQFTLDDDGDLEPGDNWPFPYIGMAFNLSKRNKIYFQAKDGDETEILYAPYQDPELIRALRYVRSYGGIKFIVNPHGIVLTKVLEDGYWQPKYVGRIDHDSWFPREN